MKSENISKKVVFFDIDGTLLYNKENCILPSTIEAIKSLATKDEYDLYISTGRTFNTINEINCIRKYFKGLNLANGGQVIINDKTIYLNTIEESIAYALIAYLEKNKISYCAVTKDTNYVMFFNQTEKDDVSSTVDAVFYELKEGEFQEFNDIVEIWVLTNNDIIDKISLDFPSLTFFKWGRYGADVLPSGRSKASGIEKIIQLQNYDLANTFAVGDASNDIPMFKLVNTSICMGQAKDEIKKEATFVTTSIDDDGLAYAIYNYILEK